VYLLTNIVVTRNSCHSELSVAS